MRWPGRLTVKANHNTGHHDHEEHEAKKVFSRHVPLWLAALLICFILSTVLDSLGGFEVEDAVSCERGRQGTGQDGAEGGAWRGGQEANNGNLHRILRLFTDEPEGEDDHSERSQKFKNKVSKLTDRECLKRKR